MPRHIDREQRRHDILTATRQVMAEEGIRAVSFRSVAQKLGGSTTLITHYFPTQADLLDAWAFWLIDTWESDVAELEAKAGSAEERLWVLLNWLVPQSDVAVNEERSRIVLLSERLLGVETQEVFESWDHKMRQMIRDHLIPLIPPEKVEVRTDVLRSITNGITLSILENPTSWNNKRIETVLEQAFHDMGLTKPNSSATRGVSGSGR